VIDQLNVSRGIVILVPFCKLKIVLEFEYCQIVNTIDSFIDSPVLWFASSVISMCVQSKIIADTGSSFKIVCEVIVIATPRAEKYFKLCLTEFDEFYVFSWQ